MSDLEQQKDEQLTRHYQQLSNEQPPAELDRAILAAAHEAVKKETSSGMDTSPVKRAWFVPVSYVAILVVSLSVVMKLALEPEVVETEMAPEKTELLIPQMRKEKQQPRLQQMPEPTESTITTVESKPEVVERKLRQAASKPTAPPSSQQLRAKSADVSTAAGLSPMLAEEGAQLSEHQREIERMLQLLENEQYEELSLALKAYREQYPADSDTYALPQELLEWESSQLKSSPQQSE